MKTNQKREIEKELSKLGRIIFWDEVNQNINGKKMLYKVAIQRAYEEEMIFLNERSKKYKISCLKL